MKICVLQRGWVLVGELEKDNNYFNLKKANFIRRWGTTKGLGEIAENGPTSDTILDPTPNVRFHESQMIFCISCSEKNWTEKNA